MWLSNEHKHLHSYVQYIHTPTMTYKLYTYTLIQLGTSTTFTTQTSWYLTYFLSLLTDEEVIQLAFPSHTYTKAHSRTQTHTQTTQWIHNSKACLLVVTTKNVNISQNSLTDRYNDGGQPSSILLHSHSFLKKKIRKLGQSSQSTSIFYLYKTYFKYFIINLPA